MLIVVTFVVGEYFFDSRIRDLSFEKNLQTFEYRLYTSAHPVAVGSKPKNRPFSEPFQFSRINTAGSVHEKMPTSKYSAA